MRFIKFNNKLVDVSGCYFEKGQWTNQGNENEQIPNIALCKHVQKSNNLEGYRAERISLEDETFKTFDLRDARFSELESMLGVSNNTTCQHQMQKVGEVVHEANGGKSIVFVMKCYKCNFIDEIQYGVP